MEDFVKLLFGELPDLGGDGIGDDGHHLAVADAAVEDFHPQHHIFCHLDAVKNLMEPFEKGLAQFLPIKQ